MSRDILHAKGRLSIEVLVATVIVREDMNDVLFQGVGNGVGSLEVRCGSSMIRMNRWQTGRANRPAHCKFHGFVQGRF
jgi:hypothetical protein